MDRNANSEQLAQAAGRLDRLQKLLQVDPGNKALQREFVETAMSAGRFDVVAELAQSALAVNPADTTALFDRASALIGQKEYRSALNSLSQLRQLVGADPAIQQNIGLCHFCLGEFEPATVALELSYAAGLRDAGAVRLLVTSYHHAGLMEQALKVAQENEEVGSGDGALAGAYALLYLDADDAMRASKWARTALRLNPKSIDGRVTEATLLTARMQTDQAQLMLEGVVNDAPATGRAWIGLGSLALLAQKMDQAKHYLARGVELMPGHVGSWHVLGWAQLMSGEIEGAQRSFQQALELDRNFAETHGALAAIAALRGEKQRAAQLIEIAQRLDRESLAVKFAEAVLLGQGGNAQQGHKLLMDTVAALSARDNSALSKLLVRSTRH
jgi:Tfp pilus assembly protein PilF